MVPRNGATDAARGGAGPRLAKSNKSQRLPPARGGDQGKQSDGLVAEWLALPGLSATLARRLANLGVGREAIHRAGGLRASRIHRVGRTFTPAEYGRWHLVSPAWAGPVPSIFEAVERPIWLDLLAWHPDQHELWLYQIGAPGLVLGEHRSGNPA